MTTRTIGVVFSSLITFFCASSLKSEETIEWLGSDSPPFHIQEGEYKNTGRNDLLMRFFQQKLPEYKHKFNILPPLRIEKKLKNKQNFCIIGSPPKKKDKNLCYSLPLGLKCPTVLLIRKEDTQKFGNSSKLSLEELLKKKKMRGGLRAGYSYGEKIDTLLNQYKNSPLLFSMSKKDPFTSLTQMLLKKRLDFIIASPAELMYQLKVKNAGNELMLIHLNESGDVFDRFIYAVCPRNNFGKKLIERINSVIVKDSGSKEYKAILTKWLSPECSEKYLKDYKIFEGVIKTHNKPLIISGHPDYPPVMWKKGDAITGAAAELARTIFDRLNVKYEIKYTGSWNRVQNNAKEGRIDMIVALYLNDTRATYTNFTEPFMQDPTAVFMLKDRAFTYNKLEDLIGKRGTTVLGESFGQEFDVFIKEKLIMERAYATETNFIKLLNGKVDYILWGYYPGTIKATSLGCFDKLKIVRGPTPTTAFHMGLSKKSDFNFLLPKINEIIKELKEKGQIKVWMDKYLKDYLKDKSKEKAPLKNND